MIAADSEVPYLVLGNQENPPPSEPRQTTFNPFVEKVKSPFTQVTLSNITRVTQVGLTTVFVKILA